MSFSANLNDQGILFTDMYQLTMAQLYFRMGLHEKTAQFDHFFRSYPDYGLHKAGYCVNAGLDWLLRWMELARFTDADIDFLRAQRGRRGTPLFDEAFLNWVKTSVSFSALTMCAVPEGRVIHPNVPITVVQGPLAVAQLLETALLNTLNYQILIATRASRIYEAGRGGVLMEFGLRRAQGPAANAGARAALIGGAHFTSNVAISRALGMAPKGTHAHSMVQAYIALGGTELDAFRAYAENYPDDCLLLVDTIDTLSSGIPNAITVFEELRAKGHAPVGIRLDSGDLAYLSIQAARMLNTAGFEEVSIVLSNQLDELTIWQIVTQIEAEAPGYGLDPDALVKRLVYGVGTRLITSDGASALDGVYKLVAVHDGGEWQPAIKISDSMDKIPNPGQKHVWRFYDSRGMAIADVLSRDGENLQQGSELTLRHPFDHTAKRSIRIDDLSGVEPLLVDVVRDGAAVYESPPIEEMRAVRLKDIARLDPGVKRLISPHIYHVSLTQRLWEYRKDLITSVRNHGTVLG